MNAPVADFERGASKAPPAALYAALAKAQGQFEDVPKTRDGHGYKYADLADVLKMVRPALSAQGLAVFQHVSGDVLITTLTHSSGESLTTHYPLVSDGTARMNNIQKIGAATTYARRYALTTLLGIAADEDTDGVDPKQSRGNVQSNGLADAWKDAVLDSLPEHATDRQKAEAFKDAILTEMRSKKRIDAIERVWTNRSKYIEQMRDKHTDLYSDLFDEFSTLVPGMREAAE